MAIVKSVNNWYNKTGAFAREIVMKQAVIMGGFVALVGYLTTAGIIPTGVGQQATGYLLVGFSVLAILVKSFWTRNSVTPADPELNPVSKNGLLLVESAVPAADAPAPYAGEHAA